MKLCSFDQPANLISYQKCPKLAQPSKSPASLKHLFYRIPDERYDKRLIWFQNKRHSKRSVQILSRNRIIMILQINVVNDSCVHGCVWPRKCETGWFRSAINTHSNIEILTIELWFNTPLLALLSSVTKCSASISCRITQFPGSISCGMVKFHIPLICNHFVGCPRHVQRQSCFVNFEKLHGVDIDIREFSVIAGHVYCHRPSLTGEPFRPMKCDVASGASICD
jgi:hypothetical protein